MLFTGDNGTINRIRSVTASTSALSLEAGTTSKISINGNSTVIITPATFLYISSGVKVGGLASDPGAGNLDIAGDTATKATGTTWANPSDSRIKENVVDYTKGLAEINQIRIREFDYNGLCGITKGIHAVGIIAQEIEPIFPRTVKSTSMKLNPDSDVKDDTDIKHFDMSEVNFALIRAVQELSVRLEKLENLQK
jgi:hypothetical protein